MRIVSISLNPRMELEIKSTSAHQSVKCQLTSATAQILSDALLVHASVVPALAGRRKAVGTHRTLFAAIDKTPIPIEFQTYERDYQRRYGSR